MEKHLIQLKQHRFDQYASKRCHFDWFWLYYNNKPSSTRYCSQTRVRFPIDKAKLELVEEELLELELAEIGAWLELNPPLLDCRVGFELSLKSTLIEPSSSLPNSPQRHSSLTHLIEVKLELELSFDLGSITKQYYFDAYWLKRCYFNQFISNFSCLQTLWAEHS